MNNYVILFLLCIIGSFYGNCLYAIIFRGKKHRKTSFKRPKGHECEISTGVCGRPTFGTGKLDDYGYWESPCWECAKAWKEQYPEDGPCWPPGENNEAL